MDVWPLVWDCLWDVFMQHNWVKTPTVGRTTKKGEKNVFLKMRLFYTSLFFFTKQILKKGLHQIIEKCILCTEPEFHKWILVSFSQKLCTVFTKIHQKSFKIALFGSIMCSKEIINYFFEKIAPSDNRKITHYYL